MNQDDYERELGERQVIDVVNARVHQASSYVSLHIPNTKTRIMRNLKYGHNRKIYHDTPIQLLECQMVCALCRFDTLENLVSAHC